MSIWSRLKTWFADGSKPRTVTWLPPSAVSPPPADVAIVAEKAYLRVWLVEMVLGKSRRWFKDYQPTVHALSTLRFGDQVVELPRIAAADPARYAQGASVLQNFLLLDLVPFRGNTVELEAGLIALPGDDHLGNALKALSNVAGLVAAPLSAALEVASKVKDSADMLIGDGAEVQLAYHNIFTAQPGANQLRPGYIAIVNIDPAKIATGALRVVDDQLCYFDNNAVQPVRNLDYLLVRIEGVAHRDDLRAFSDLARLRTAALDAYIKDGDAAGDQAYRAALAAIVSHPELINADRRTLAAELKADCDTYRGSTHGAVPDVAPRAWHEFVDGVKAGADHAPVTVAEFS